MEYTHEKYGKYSIAEITQGQMEVFLSAMKDVPTEPATNYYGAVVRGAVKAGFMFNPSVTEDAVNAAKPSFIRWLANCVGKEIQEALRDDPLP